MRATQPLCRRIRHFKLTTKQGPKDYYKGTRSGSMGRHTKHGGYIIDYDKVRTYVVPEGLSECKLTPFVSKKIQPLPREDRWKKSKAMPTRAHWYLEEWKESYLKNGED